MIEQRFERRARVWLELGPTQAPVEAVQNVLMAIETIPQDQPRFGWLRRLRRAGGRPTGRLALLAAALLLAAAFGAAFYVGSHSNTPTPAPTPVPSPATLPDLARLAAPFAGSTILIERSVGPANAPVSASTTTTRHELGPVRLQQGYFISLACLGPGSMNVEIVAGGRAVLPVVPNPCGGGAAEFDFPSLQANEIGEDVTVAVTIADGASWRFILGEYLAPPDTPPNFPTPALTAGWNYMTDMRPSAISSPTTGGGFRFQVPQKATRAGVFVQCSGESVVSVSANDSAPTKVDCRGGAAQRIEYPVTGGEDLSVKAVPDGLAWIRLYVEVDSEIATTYPAAPPLPDDVAQTPYSVEAEDFLTLGTLGSNHQALIPVRWARTGLAGGDFVAASIPDETTGDWRLDLYSVSEAKVIRTLVEVPSPGQLVTGLVDATHGQVFYLVGRSDGSAEYRRVALDGTDDRLLIPLPAGGISFALNLSRDDSLIVVEFCASATDCSRRVLDAATLESETVDLPALAVCRIDAVVEGLIVETSGGPCGGPETPFVTWATPLDGGDRRLLVEGAIDRYVVETRDGPKLVYSTGWTPDAGNTFHVLDIASGHTEVLLSFDSDSPLGGHSLGAARLPPGWILLAGNLSDRPAGTFTLGAAPLLVNVETGEQIELVNLPHKG